MDAKLFRITYERYAKKEIAHIGSSVSMTKNPDLTPKSFTMTFYSSNEKDNAFYDVVFSAEDFETMIERFNNLKKQ